MKCLLGLRDVGMPSTSHSGNSWHKLAMWIIDSARRLLERNRTLGERSRREQSHPSKLQLPSGTPAIRAPSRYFSSAFVFRCRGTARNVRIHEMVAFGCLASTLAAYA
jgi:hypothetical protein